MKKYFTFLPSAVALFALAFSSGCNHLEGIELKRGGPFFTPTNFAGETFLGGIRRVVLLPVWGGSVASVESAAAFDSVFLTALQQQNRFEVVTLSREDCLRQFGAEALSSSGALPQNLLAVLRREYAADAVLFVDLTVFNAYRPIELGLRGKLASIDGSKLLWTFDTVFSAADPAVANSARRHFEATPTGVPADLTPAVLQSPSRFATYAADTMFGTLPPVTEPVVLAKANAKK